MLRKTLFGCALATLVTLFSATTAVAQEPSDQRTFFTFSAPYELPGGKVLPAGKYTFRIVDSPSNRHVVQILSEDGKDVHATILAIPAQRQDPPDDPEVRFMETVANAPPAVKTWWYPGRTIGHEFIYPKAQARRLAAAQREPVLTVDTEMTSTEQMQTADLERIDAAGTETDVAVTTETTTTRAERQAPPARTPAPDRMPAPAPTRTVETTRVEETRTALPTTASLLPLMGLIGIASLAGAAVIRRRR